MINRMFFSLLCSAVLFVTVPAYADDVTFVLQNGTNGYIGCTDTYTEYGGGATGLRDEHLEHLCIGGNYCIV